MINDFYMGSFDVKNSEIYGRGVREEKAMSGSQEPGDGWIIIAWWMAYSGESYMLSDHLMSVLC